MVYACHQYSLTLSCTTKQQLDEIGPVLFLVGVPVEFAKAVTTIFCQPAQKYWRGDQADLELDLYLYLNLNLQQKSGPLQQQLQPRLQACEASSIAKRV